MRGEDILLLEAADRLREMTESHAKLRHERDEARAQVAAMTEALHTIDQVMSGCAPVDRGVAILHKDRREIDQAVSVLTNIPARAKAIAEVVEAAKRLNVLQCDGSLYAREHVADAWIALRKALAALEGK